MPNGTGTFHGNRHMQMSGPKIVPKCSENDKIVEISFAISKTNHDKNAMK